ncbi:MAG: hypothetical protein PHV28_00530 [Kiritimatiellae bacterium]|nr:hypothetical protein [Kiritimatiellia bacterium]
MKGFWIGLLMATACHGALENVALKKPYTLSPTPGYRHCTDPDDKIQLTDGVFSKGYFWMQKGTVGWHNVLPITCVIDLGKVEPICGVSWSCAAGTAGVAWPQSLYVLVSEDKKVWTCLGDLCQLGTENHALPEGYATFRYATDRMKGRGRYVCVLAVARPSCFVDEIEVWRGPDEWLKGVMPGQRTDDLKRFYTESCVISGVAARMREDLRIISDQAVALGYIAVTEELKARGADLEKGIPGDAQKMASISLQTVLPYEGVHKRILALNAPVLRAAGVVRPLVWQGNRWDPLALTDVPPQSCRAGIDGITIDLMRGEVRGEAFNITNPGDKELDVELAVSGIPDAARVELREVLVTDTLSRKPVAAALRRIEPGAEGVRRLTVPAGCTRQVWVSSLRPVGEQSRSWLSWVSSCWASLVRGGEAGAYHGVIRLASKDGAFSKGLALSVKVRDLDFPKRPSLHLGGWDYLQGKGDTYKAPGNLDPNLALMRDMYVDSPWATWAVAPKGAVFDAEGRLQNKDALDFSVWDAWVARWGGARNYCVAFGTGVSFNGEKMGTPRFNMMVGTWFAAWVEHLKKQGLKPGQYVLLLLDEPHEPGMDARIIAWAAAIRAAKLGIVIFEDPAYADPTKGDPAMFAACDVLCPHAPTMVAQGKPFRDFYLRQKEAGKTLWLYSCCGPAKLLDPVTYHRAQAWLAFQTGAEGSFFWAFGCGGGIGDSWRAHLQTHNEYSPYFVGPDSVMEGKHSEAIRESVQDYEYLRMLRDKVARVKATGQDTPWLARAEALLTEGVAEAVKAVTSSNMFWKTEKNRSAMDTVRVQILDALDAEETEKRGER